MTSMFSANRPTPSFGGHNESRELQTKKETLTSLEQALKKRISELKELCLKEGELTGHLPIDYPLQPREPIPQVRRKVTQLATNNNSNTYKNGTNATSSGNILSNSQQQNFNFQSSTNRSNIHQSQNPNGLVPILSRPTSTNSTSSSLSTASANNRTTNNNSMTSIINGYSNKSLPTSHSHPSSLSAGMNSHNQQCGSNSSNLHYSKQMNQSQSTCYPAMRSNSSSTTNQYKKPSMTAATFAQDVDTLSQVRASSTTSSISSSGSAASSTLSAPVASQFKVPYTVNNMHARSCSENIIADGQMRSNQRFHSSIPQHQQANGTHLIANGLADAKYNPKPHSSMSATTLNLNSQPPARPPRGLNSIGNLGASIETVKANELYAMKRDAAAPLQVIPNVQIRGNLCNRTDELNGDDAGDSLANNMKPLHLFDINEVSKFQTYYEETKPFQMSDFYKYSSKHRSQKSENDSPNRPKTTRQLQDDVSKNSLKFSSCDDQIQASVKLIEKSGQKLFEATAKAIAGNPALAEKLSNILPNNKGDRY